MHDLCLKPGQKTQITCIIQKDNLGVNDCVVAIEEKKLSVMRQMLGDDENRTPTFLVLSCLGHGIILSTKQVTNRRSQMPSKLVRLGRLTESGKFRDDFETALDKEVERRFR